jgi:hypothetical protein
MVEDYKGNLIPVENAVWCEYDKKWSLRDEAIWVDYQGFWTTPTLNFKMDYWEDIIPKEEDKTVVIKWYKKGKLE